MMVKFDTNKSIRISTKKDIHKKYNHCVIKLFNNYHGTLISVTEREIFKNEGVS